MAEFASELRRWLALTPEPEAFDISALSDAFKAKMQAQIANEDIAEQRQEQAQAALRRLMELLTPLNQALRDLYPRAVINGSPDEFTRNTVKTHAYGGSREISWRQQRLSHITLESGYRDFALRFAFAVELADDGGLIVHMEILVGPTRTMGGIRFQWNPDMWEAPVGSIEVEEMLREAVREAGPQLRDAIAAFAEHAPA